MEPLKLLVCRDIATRSVARFTPSFVFHLVCIWKFHPFDTLLGGLTCLFLVATIWTVCDLNIIIFASVFPCLTDVLPLQVLFTSRNINSKKPRKKDHTLPFSNRYTPPSKHPYLELGIPRPSIITDSLLFC